MVQRHFIVLALILLSLLPILPVSGAGNTEVRQMRMRVAMRMIGHEVLLSSGDCESRVLPIRKTGNQYKIPFEKDFGFDPGVIVPVIDRIMQETVPGTNYLVEMVQCETGAVMYGFEIGNPVNRSLIPCEGRTIPEGCYTLLITLFDAPVSSGQISANASEAWPIATSILTLLILIGSASYFMKSKQAAKTDPDLVLIGASRFDQRNRTLSFRDKQIMLSNKEAELLSILNNSVNKPLEREIILRKVWGDDGDYVGRTVDVFISKLRKKLEQDASVKIVNIRGFGYKLVTEPAK